jgi:esterase/lipase superfamily enzyme
MKVEYHKLWSRALNRDMELKTYGHAGRPILVFPSACGRFYEYEDFGMIEAARAYIEAGRTQFVAVDSIDCEAWLAQWMRPEDRGWRHVEYERYIIEEIVPFIRAQTGIDGGFLTTGCSMGAYHAVNFYFKHPKIFGGVIALSGLYGPQYFVGDYMDDNVYFNFPLCYLPALTDPYYIDLYRQGDIIICTGTGAWEEDSIRETKALEENLRALDVPAWFDYWGGDVNHDWPWWRKQLPYFLEKTV